LIGFLNGNQGLAGGLGNLLSTLTPRFLAQQAGSFWLPSQASTTAGQVDKVFYFIFWVSVFFFVLIVALMIFFAIRYRRQPGKDPDSSPSHNTALEITWSVIPFILVIIIFIMGFRSFLDMATPPGNAYEILVTGQKWKWFFTYPNGYVDEELHVPVDENIRLVLTSEDVIHSLFIPAFRVKMDAVPGRYNKTWFRPTTPGQFELLCTEYCGTGHSDMLTWAVVHEPGGFETWLQQASDLLATLSPPEAGERLYKVRGCKQCHTIDGSAGIGPTFWESFGKRRPLQDGSNVLVDENYLRESILNPQTKIAAGFEPVMPTYQGKVSDQEITALIAYVKTLTAEVSAPEEAQ
jgi:cytochrome c oxidase subunit 2